MAMINLESLNLKNRGSSLAEVVVAAFVISIALTALLASYTLYLRTALGTTTRIQAAFLLEEGQELARFNRDNGWTANMQNGTTVTYIDNFFERRVTIADASIADLNSNQIKQVTVAVAWPDHGATSSVSSVTRLVNFLND